MGILLLLFIAVPAVELILLLELGRLVGVFETVALIVLTGVVGATLARNQGLLVLSQAQRELAEGRMPADSLVDGLMILVAAALLVTPGVLTDGFGFLCLIPVFRAGVKRQLRRRLKQALEEGRLHVNFRDGFPRPDAGGDPGPDDLRRTRFWRDAARRGPIVDATFEPADDSGQEPDSEPDRDA
jgi:UPF0716 protein FxsA